MRRPSEIRRPLVADGLSSVESAELCDHAELREMMTSQSWADASAKGAHFETMRLTRASLARVRLERPEFLDVIGAACDMSSSELEEPVLTRVELSGCTMVGARWSDGRFTDVRFVDCQLELASFWAARFTRVIFERCKLREADFHGADLSGVVFKECDLALTSWADTKLKGTDFTTSDISGIKLAPSATMGLIVSRTQAVELARIFGLVVT